MKRKSRVTLEQFDAGRRHTFVRKRLFDPVNKAFRQKQMGVREYLARFRLTAGFEKATVFGRDPSLHRMTMDTDLVACRCVVTRLIDPSGRAVDPGP
jgi:hypothetical protein